MATDTLFHWSAKQKPGYPAWVNRSMFVGQYTSPSNHSVMVTPVNGKSGKVTNGFLKALFRAAMIQNGCDKNAYGNNDKFGIAEYTDNETYEGKIVGLGETICVTYAKDTGKFMATKGGRKFEPAKESAAALFLAMWGYFCKDPEFSSQFDSFCIAQDDDIKASTACWLADKAYHMVSDKANPMLVCDPVAISNLSATKMALPNVKPTEWCGTFELFDSIKSAKKTGRAKKSLPKTVDFVGSYAFSKEPLTEEQAKMVPVLTDKYIVSEELIFSCEHIFKTTGKSQPVRNLLFRGEPGAGKSMLGKGIAAGCNKPFYTFAGNAMTEPFDLFGQFVPVDEDGNQSGPKVPVEEILKSMPSPEDIHMDPVFSYQQITGLHKENATATDCMSAAFQLAQRSLDRGEEKQKFKFVPGQLILALKNGGVWQFDELNLPQNPGVAAALNPLMDSIQSTTLPTGEVVKRHPDCVFIATMNVDLEGCHQLSQALGNRFHLTIDVAAPEDELLIARLKADVDYDDVANVDIDLAKYVRAYGELREIAKKRRLNDGTIGPRNLSNWVTSVMITGDPILSARRTIVSGATSDERGMAELIEKLEDIF